MKMELLVLAREHYLKIFVIKHKEVIKELTSLRNEIQAIAKHQKELSSFTCLNGILGGGIILGGLFLSPFTGGGSFCVAYGTLYGLVYKGMDIIGDTTFSFSIKEKLSEATTKLEEYSQTLKTMYGYLKELQKYIEIVDRDMRNIDRELSEINDKFVEMLDFTSHIGRVALGMKHLNTHTISSQGGEIYRLLKLKEPLRGVMSNAARQAAKEAAKGAAKGAVKGAARNIANVGSRRLAKRYAEKAVEETAVMSTRIMGTVAAIGIILDLKTLISNQSDLAKFDSGQWCDQAGLFKRAIEDMENEFELITKFFKLT